jgi:hypothetical protein
MSGVYGDVALARGAEIDEVGPDTEDRNDFKFRQRSD